MSVKVTVIPEHTNAKFLIRQDDGSYLVDKDAIIWQCAKEAGICYSEEGWGVLQDEDPAKTARRIETLLGPDDGSGKSNEHSSPFENISLGLHIVAPKILMMVLNNEKQYTTSERSLRYTKPILDNFVSPLEFKLYEEWVRTFEVLIKERYPGEPYMSGFRITKLAQENARYLTSVFTRTEMIHTVPWIQLNRIAAYMEDFIAAVAADNGDSNDFFVRIAGCLAEFVAGLRRLNILDERAMSNRKERKLSLFGDYIVDEYFGDVYSTNYLGSFATLAQTHRSRPISYDIILLPEQEFYIPQIIRPDPKLVNRWLYHMGIVARDYPQGMKVNINERGTIEAFLLKCKERLCTAAQPETMLQTAETFQKFPNLGEFKGSRCLQFGYKCIQPCGFADGINCTRII